MKKTIIDNLYNFKTKNKEGLTNKEIDVFLEENYPHIGIDKLNKAMGVITCLLRDGDVIKYHSDIEMALRIITEKRCPLSYAID